MLDMGTTLQFWAKKKVQPDELRHPLLFHMLDVANVAQALWNHSLQPSIKEWLSNELGLKEMDAICCLSFWAGVHDLGKASPGFQKMSEHAKAALEEQGFSFPPSVLSKELGHSIISAQVLPDIVQGLGQAETVESAEFIRAASIAVGGHHGAFPTAGQRGRVGRHQLGDNAWSEARKALADRLRELTVPGRPITPKNRPGHPFYIVLAALTSVADWIGSNDTFFPYETGSQSIEDYTAISLERAKAALENLGWTSPQPAADVATLLQLFPYIEELRPLQEAALSLTQLPSQPGLALIEAPMGEGKTEAALYLAHRWQAEAGKQGYYVALPTQATSNQMFTRVKAALENGYSGMKVNFQLIHGASLLNEQFQQLRLASVGDGRNDGVSAEEWFLNKKRALLAPFGVGTVDQALLSVLQTRHFFIRLLGLCQKTVIIDEVHAYDIYMSTLLKRMLQWLAALGSRVVLLSATLPAEYRKALFEAYNQGQPVSPPEKPYPRITWLSGGKVESVGFSASRPCVLKLRLMYDTLDSLINDLLLSISQGGHVAIVCNTVGRAQKTYNALKTAGFLQEGELQLLHARYPYTHREAREQKVLETFGKERQRDGKVVLVSTQIIEQSLDLDFDLMVTDLAPADLVIQRAGRVHRHQHHQRPPHMAEPTLWVRMPKAAANGLPDFAEAGRIYDKYILLRSYLSLTRRKTIAVPDDIEAIIEEVYGDAHFPWPSPKIEAEAWRLKEELNRQQEKDCLIAKLNMVGEPFSREEPAIYLSQFNKQLEEDEPELHHSLQALTRLAEPSVQVVCLYRSGDGLFYQQNGSGGRVDPNARPQPDDIRNLLRQSMSISWPGLVQEIIKCCPIPSAWQEIAALRHHRLLVFEDGQCRVVPYLLTMDDELGLLIDKD